MPRHARYVIPGVPLHITQRAVNRQTCFADDLDKYLYVRLMEDFSKEAQCDVHVYVIMNNHVHVLATPRLKEAPGEMMKAVGQIYTQHFNRKYQRCGTLWSGRFKSCPVDEAAYLMCCYRYIELNPIRAGMVWHPSGYAWSSYSANAFGTPSWVVPHRLYRLLGDDPKDRHLNYQRYVAHGSTQEELQRIRIATQAGSPLGDHDFIERLQREFGVTCQMDRATVSLKEKVVCPRF